MEGGNEYHAYHHHRIGSSEDGEDEMSQSDSQEDDRNSNDDDDDVIDEMNGRVGAKVRSRMQLYCEICDTSSSSTENLQVHFAGSKHQRRLHMAGLNSDLTDLIERPRNLEIWKTVVKCLLCKVMMLGCDCLIHAKCEDHVTKLASMSQRNQDFYNDISNCYKPVERDPSAADVDAESRDFFCEMCHLQLSSKEHLELHLKGKKHQKKARWLYISDHNSSFRDSYRQIWCSLCRTFVNNLKELEYHLRGRDHVKMLKREGVKWKALVDVYGEDVVGMPPIQRPLPPPSTAKELTLRSAAGSSGGRRGGGRSPSWSPPPMRSRHHSDDHAVVVGGVAGKGAGDEDHKRRHSSSLSLRHPNTPDIVLSVKEESYSHRSRSRSRSPRCYGNSPPRLPSSSAAAAAEEDEGGGGDVPFTPLRHFKWSETYAAIPDYNPRHPKILRQGRRKTGGSVIYQYPLLAVGEFVGELGNEDPRLAEMEERVRAVTLVRETREKQVQELEERERGRGGGVGEKRGAWRGSRRSRGARLGRSSSRGRGAEGRSGSGGVRDWRGPKRSFRGSRRDSSSSSYHVRDYSRTDSRKHLH